MKEPCADSGRRVLSSVGEPINPRRDFGTIASSRAPLPNRRYPAARAVSDEVTVFERGKVRLHEMPAVLLDYRLRR